MNLYRNYIVVLRKIVFVKIKVISFEGIFFLYEVI